MFHGQDSVLPMLGAGIQALVREMGSYTLHSQKEKKKVHQDCGPPKKNRGHDKNGETACQRDYLPDVPVTYNHFTPVD